MEIFTLSTPLDRDRTFIATSVLKPSMLEKVKIHLHVIKTHCSAQSGSLPTNHPVSLLVEMRTSPAKACICILLSVLKNKVVTQKKTASCCWEAHSPLGCTQWSLTCSPPIQSHFLCVLLFGLPMPMFIISLMTVWCAKYPAMG